MPKALIVVLSLLGVLLFAGLVSAGVWIANIAQDPEGMTVTIDGPDTVAVGEEFTLTVVVANTRKDAPLTVGDIDLADAYVKDFYIAASEPTAESSEHIPLANIQSFTFNTSIPPGQEQRFTFRLKASKTGVYRGDVDVYEGTSRFLTVTAQTMVVEKP